MENRPCWTGLISGLSATVAWGLFPIYWKQFGPVGSLEAFCHKVLWSGVVAALFLTVQGRWGEVQAVVTQPRRLRWFLLSGVLIALNGFLFIYTVSSGHVMESSLGYYLTPLACFVLGKLFLRERLRPLQRLAVGLAAGGVAWLTVKYGHFPWLATGLCLSFGCYGLVRKMAPAGSLVGFFLETLWLSPLAAALIMGLLAGHHGSFIYAGPRISGLLCGAGVVTALPRLWFAAAARQISLTTLGLLEYTTPTLMFALSASTYHEAVTGDHLIAFGLIWLGIAVYTLEGFGQAANAAQSQPALRTDPPAGGSLGPFDSSRSAASLRGTSPASTWPAGSIP